MTGSPDAPAQAPLLWSLLAFVRRDIETFFSGFAGTPVLGPAATASLLVTSPNLLLNPGAEFGDPSLSGYSSVTVPGWTVTGTPTVIEYGTQRRFPLGLPTPGPTFPSFLAFPGVNSLPDGGAQFFAGGDVATSTLSQIINLSAAASDIDSGTVPFTLSGDLGGFLIDPSAASVKVTFLDASNHPLGTGLIGPVGAIPRLFQTGFVERETSGIVPVGTRTAQVVLTLNDGNLFPGNYNNAYADNLSFTVGANLPDPGDPTPPDSTVGALDHVFMVYMENKGYNDIVGSPNAPYLNGLINNYGFESDYFALTHPSSPNYYPILGGTDFGFNYNCPSNCFDATNLADKIEAAGKTWAGYMQGMPSPGFKESAPGYDPSETPFFAFRDIFNDPARAETHLFPLTQMATDLSSTATTPNFVWFAANEDNNGEGPIDFPFGALQFALTQITDHQYNVPALDAFLKQTVGTIMSSTSWNTDDPTNKSAIVITFDEDNNNLSLGFGNQGNHVVTVVIPNQAAIDFGGMNSGHFVVNDYANHYSLLRTIEDSLSLPAILGPNARLTDNDAYAYPMNGFWA